jgi:branched-chain amino acid transport system permease protein
VDWGAIVQNALRAAFGLEAAYFALAAIGLNVHFGYTGLLNFGRPASWPSAPTAWASP